MRYNLYVEVVLCVSDARYNGGNDHENEQESRDWRIFEARRKHLELFDMFGLCNVYVVVAFTVLMPWQLQHRLHFDFDILSLIDPGCFPFIFNNICRCHCSQSCSLLQNFIRSVRQFCLLLNYLILIQI